MLDHHTIEREEQEQHREEDETDYVQYGMYKENEWDKKK